MKREPTDAEIDQLLADTKWRPKTNGKRNLYLRETAGKLGVLFSRVAQIAWRIARATIKNWPSVALALLLACPALATVTVDSADSSAHTGTTTASFSTTGYNFTNTAGTVLYVCATANSAGGTATDITALTYNGVSMTLVGKRRYDTGNAVVVSLWRLLSPATGSNAVKGTITSSALNRWIVGAISFTGNDTSTPDSTPTCGTGSVNVSSCVNTGNSATPTVTVNSTTAGNMLVDCAATGTSLLTSNQTLLWRSSPASGATGGDNAASSRANAGGAVTMSYSVTADLWGIAAVEVRQVQAAPPPATMYQAPTRLILRNSGSKQ